MALFDRVSEFLSLGVAPKPVVLPDPQKVTWLNQAQYIEQNRVQTRAIDSFTSMPGLDAQLLAVQGLTDRPWRYPGINEALGTPAIFRAVSLIANTTGSLAVEAFRRGVKLPDEETPRVVKRPDPFTIPRNFYRDTAYFLATRGESWWWVGARDTDGLAMSLIVVPPWEITIEATDDRLRPIIRWLNKEMRREDLRHLTFLRDDSGYRGVGPLQLCGAAISVAVEAQNWAANFYADGGYPSIVIKSATELGNNPDFSNAQAEADAMRGAWVAREANTPRVIDPGIESIEKFDVDEQSTGALEGRNRNDGDAARMFGIPGALLEYATSGSSLTYQNVAEVYRQFVQTCLAPNYLEPIEQEMSDLLPRTTVARFNVKGLLRADIATRFNTYAIGIANGIFTAETAAAEEGYLPGDVEFAPVPFSEPSAIPTRLPVQLRSEPEPVRCTGKRMLRGLLKPCNKLLAEAGPFSGTCPRCNKVYVAPPFVPQIVQSNAAVTMPLAVRTLTVEPVREPLPELVEPPDPYLEAIRAQTEAIRAQNEILGRPQPQPQMTISEGAVRVEVHTPPMTIADGAIRIDNHVAAPDMSMMPAAQMTIAEGAIRVDGPTINVEPSPVTISEGAVRVDVAAPDMSAFRSQPDPSSVTRIVKDEDGNVRISRDVA